MEFPTKSEKVLLDVLWKANRPLSTAEIIEQADSHCTRSTMRVRLFQLSKKGLVKSDKKGREYFYTPINRLAFNQKLIASKLHTKLSQSIEDLILTYTGNDKTPANEEKVCKMLEELSSEKEKT